MTLKRKVPSGNLLMPHIGCQENDVLTIVVGKRIKTDNRLLNEVPGLTIEIARKNN